MFLILATLLLTSNCKMIKFLNVYDPNSNTKKALKLYTMVFTVSYLLRAITMLVVNFWPTDSWYILKDNFQRFLVMYLSNLVWDLPPILSTVHLNFLLLQELRVKKEEKSRQNAMRINLYKEITLSEELNITKLNS
jgi:hypothetical protein